MIFVLNGKELELDLFDVDVAEKMEKAIITSANEMIALGETQQQSCFDTMRKGCHIVFHFFDSIWGEGTAKTLFDGKTNYKVCLETYATCAGQYKEYMTEGATEEMMAFLSVEQKEKDSEVFKKNKKREKERKKQQSEIQRAKEKLQKILLTEPEKLPSLLKCYESRQPS